MAEAQQLEPAAGDDRQLKVGNLPNNCEKVFIENFFESRKQFGDGIEVEHVDIHNDEAVVTFRRATDVDQVLQRHCEKPCVLGKKVLTLKPLNTDCDAPDGGPFVSREENNISDSFINSGGFDILKSFDSSWSICSIKSDISVDSSELFGSGGEKYQSIFSEEYTELHLIYRPPSQDGEECKVKLCETNISPVLISYAATTCPTTQSASISNSTKPSRVPNKAQSMLHEKLGKTFGCAIDVKVVKADIVLTLSENVDRVKNIDDLQRAVLVDLKSFEESITIQLLELKGRRILLLNHCKDRTCRVVLEVSSYSCTQQILAGIPARVAPLTGERSYLAIKHFKPVLEKKPEVKLYRTEDDTSLVIAFQSQNDKRLVDSHIAVVKEQSVIRQEKPLPVTDYFKVKAYMSKFKTQNADLTLEKSRMIIYGFQEDVTATVYQINKVLLTSHCATKRLGDFAVKLLKNREILTEIKQKMADAKLKVWWEVSDHFINVVGKNEKQASEAIELIVNHFYTCEIEIPDYLLDSRPWETDKTLAVVNSHHRLMIDDTAKRPVVIVKGIRTECKTFVDTANEFKRQCTRVIKRKQLTQVKCDFVLKFQREEIESDDIADFLRLYQDSDKTIVKAEGTESAQARLDSKLKEIATQRVWICDESAADRLKKLSEDKGHQWKGTVGVFESQTKLSLKTGRIEEEQVDIVVNSAAKDLNLGTGNETITQSLRAAGGEQVQTSLLNIQTPVTVGSVVDGDGGNMNCKRIYHAVLEKYDPNDTPSSIKNLKKVVTVCLDKASKAGHTSIAFPALCTGVHEYPVKVVAETMLDSITEYIIQNEQRSLKQIVIVFLKVDGRKRQSFEKVQNNLESLGTKKMLWNTLSWPCRYFCRITAATSKLVKEVTQHVNAELMEQTFAKRLEQTE